jgi:hypothetical protein
MTSAARSVLTALACVLAWIVVPATASAGLPATASGNDSEAAVEALLSQELGPGVDVAPLATGVTGDDGTFDFAPDDITRAQDFSWSYRGTASNLAYVSVKAGDRFAVIGVAGSITGNVDVAGLLGRNDISHVSFWATTTSLVAPVPARKVHGKGFLGNSRLGRIEGGKVPCLQSETFEPALCRFATRGAGSGDWLESPDGTFARVGQSISLDGEPGGDYVVASKVRSDGRVAALEPSGRDAAGTASGTELAGWCYYETFLSSKNASGLRLDNYATRLVGTSSYPHPDGVIPVSAGGGIYYYTGRGAALNDINGTERDQSNIYLSGNSHCHVALSGGYEVFAAKRPSVRSYPAPGSVDTSTAILWRPVTSVRVAN